MLSINDNLIDSYTINDSHVYFVIDKIGDIKKTIHYKYSEEYLLDYIEHSIADIKEKSKSINSKLTSSLIKEIDSIDEWYSTEYKRYPIFDYNISTHDIQRFISLKYEKNIKYDYLL